MAKKWKKPPSFERFIKNKSNAGLSATAVIQKYREKGGKIANAKAKQLFNEVTGRVTNRKSTRIKMYGNDKLNPQQKKYLKDDYLYIISYKTLVQNEDEEWEKDPSGETYFVTIATKERITSRADAEILLGRYIDDIQMMGSKYTLEAVDWDSVRVLYGVDKNKMPKRPKGSSGKKPKQPKGKKPKNKKKEIGNGDG